tara:strand:- start:1075 stop:1377 length:303 start_codon:yes stop_codon:yes gene_type:complete
MPANPKYLSKSPQQQFAKITAGIIGGYCITALIHMSFALWLPWHKEVLISSILTYFVVWSVFLILPFLFSNGWKAWFWYVLSMLLLYALYYAGQLNNPFL